MRMMGCGEGDLIRPAEFGQDFIIAVVVLIIVKIEEVLRPKLVILVAPADPSIKASQAHFLNVIEGQSFLYRFFLHLSRRFLLFVCLFSYCCSIQVDH